MFQASTTAGKIFDIGLFILIVSNITLLMLESVPSVSLKYAAVFKTLDIIFLVLFSIEYLLRLYCVRSAKRYAASFYGMIDLLAILPSYMEFFYPQWHVFMIVRSFRLLRIFRIFKMVRFLDESRVLMFALVKSFRKIIVFLFFVLLLAIFLGSLMYVVEFQHNPGFNTIPQSIYWAVVTITTVGYGDVAPATAVGKIIASFIMILGYAIIAVPTGIMSAAVIQEEKKSRKKHCPHCFAAVYGKEAAFCSACGQKLDQSF
ncbi:ion transporter [Niabella soli DSM 19437]|uniref:Ion transporter n=1 Tax=Niabella soli DSM 19437 TaxID=929713 RepID=W0EZ28_9BACT|nr:ion transporter [Niabella soli DSM 19437]